MDLRGALKYWLEQAGFEVLLSEYTDMDKLPGKNAMDACFDSVRRGDYYVLLLGEKRGSLFSSNPQVSVTQQEFRTARESFLAIGRPIPLLFVRDRVATQLSAWRRRTPPPFEDAAFVRSFLGEVRADRETENAISGLGIFPIANWLDRFRDFRDLVEALTHGLALRIDVALQRRFVAAASECELALGELVWKLHLASDRGYRQYALELVRDSLTDEEKVAMVENPDTPFDAMFPLHRILDPLIDAHHLERSGNSDVVLNREERKRLLDYLVALARGRSERLGLSGLRDAFASGAFLRYDPQTRTFEETDTSAAVNELLTEVEAYAKRYDFVNDEWEAVANRIRLANERNAPSMQLSADHAVRLWSFHATQKNLFLRLGALHAFLTGKTGSPLPGRLVPSSPFGPEHDELLKQEQPTAAELRQWTRTRDVSAI